MRTLLHPRLALPFACALIASAPCWTGDVATAEVHQILCQIAQPVLSEDEHLVERHYVTYALQVGSTAPGLEVRLTCHPGAGVVHGDASRDTVDYSEITNLNIANMLGISIQVENRPRGTWNLAADSSRARGASTDTRFFIDHLHVTLNLKTLNDREPVPSDPSFGTTMGRFDAVVAATVDCILDNASRSDPPIRRLDLRVFGSPRYGRYARVYPITAAPKRKQYRF